MKEIKFEFKLRLNVDSWGRYSKGDIEYFHINLIDEKNGLVRWPIDKHWDILDYEILKD